MRSVFLLALLAAPAALAQPGALDPTLGDGAGFVVSEYGGYNEPAVLLLQPDGLAVLVGYGFGDIKIARYLPDGTLDAAFGTGGTVTYDSGYDFVRIAAAALQPDGKIVMAGGGGGITASDDRVLARFLPDGTPDPSFGEDGLVVTDLSSYERLTGLALLPDGKLITAGVGLLLRYLPDGTLDAAFGTGGSAPLTIGNYGRSGLAVQPDGRIVVGGTETGGGGDHAVLERHLPDGALDVTFGNGGVRSLPSGNGTQTREVLVRPDGRLLVLVQGAEGGGYRYGLAQLLPDGTLDPAFGGGNGYTANGELGLPQNVQGEHVALFPDGRIAGVGWRFAPPDDFSLLVARHLPDGALDPVFGNGGFVASTLGGDQALGYGGAAVLPDGRLLVGGQYVSNSTYEFLLASLLDDAAVAVSAAPTAPATIPPGGGAFAFTLRLANATDQPQTVEAWTEADGPASRSPVLGPRSVTLAPHATLTRTLTQRVPGSAPAGDYVYAVRAGAFPDGAVTSASFPVTKAAGALAARTSGDAVWTIEGWDETAAPASAASEVPAALSLSSASPNPFRGGARITLAVPSAQPFRVAVYDALGREVAVLLDGEAEAGAHALALDGRGLAAGVYVVRAEGAGAVAVRRVVRY